MIKIFGRKPMPSVLSSIGQMIVNLMEMQADLAGMIGGLTKMVADVAGMIANHSKNHSVGLRMLGDVNARHVAQERQSIQTLERLETRMDGIERGAVADVVETGGGVISGLFNEP